MKKNRSKKAKQLINTLVQANSDAPIDLCNICNFCIVSCNLCSIGA